MFRTAFTTAGGRIQSFELKEYESDAHDGEALEMVVADGLLPLGVYWLDEGGNVVGDQDVDYRIEVERPAGAGSTVVRLTGTAAPGLTIEKTLTLHDGSYLLDYTVVVGGEATDREVGVAWARAVHEGRSRFSGKEGPVALLADKLHAENAASMKEPVLLDGEVAWAGYADHYFLAAYIPDEPVRARFVGAASGGVGEATLWARAPGGRVQYSLFVGPKRLDLLGSVGHGLERSVDFGWFAFVARPLLGLLIFLYSFTGNYGWSIVLLTVGIRIVFYPINKRQAEAMKAMQRIQPELKKLQEKYKDDRERLNREMMELYRRHKVNPLSGCLPMLVQLPVFFGLYRALMEAIELRHAPFIGWITDLSQPDRLGSLAIPFVSPPGIPVLTLLMG
ncbi:MAG: membrane protein insertase YidC, partial [Deltaproteobacteria bacterium]